MEDKPKEILELERALGIDHIDTYMLNGDDKIISLTIIHQNLKDITPLTKCLYLEELSLYNNRITDLTPLYSLLRLNYLDLHYNNIYDISPLSNLTSLNYLNVIMNEISDISPLSELKMLNELHLSGNKINDLSPLSKLKDLNRLDLFNNKINDISHLAEMKALNTLSLGSNRINDITAIGSLKSLNSLYLFKNHISDISHLSTLDNLNYIDLRHNKITDLTPLKKFIDGGFDVLLNSNNRPKYSFRNIIFVGENPLLNPPISIVQNGNEYIMAHFNDIAEHGEFEILEAKLLIIGEPKAGKTTLRKKIFNLDYPVPCDEEKETIGVQIQQGWNFPFSKDPTKTFHS